MQAYNTQPQRTNCLAHLYPNLMFLCLKNRTQGSYLKTWHACSFPLEALGSRSPGAECALQHISCQLQAVTIIPPLAAAAPGLLRLDIAVHGCCHNTSSGRSGASSGRCGAHAPHAGPQWQVSLGAAPLTE